MHSIAWSLKKLNKNKNLIASFSIDFSHYAIIAQIECIYDMDCYSVRKHLGVVNISNIDRIYI